MERSSGQQDNSYSRFTVDKLLPNSDDDGVAVVPTFTAIRASNGEDCRHSHVLAFGRAFGNLRS